MERIRIRGTTLKILSPLISSYDAMMQSVDECGESGERIRE